MVSSQRNESTGACRRLTGSKIAVSGRGDDAGGNAVVVRSRGNVLAVELAEEPGVDLVEGARAAEAVHLAGTAQILGASLVGRGRGGSKELTVDGVLNNNRDVLEDITLSKNVATLTNLKGVAGVVLPVVVDLLMLVWTLQAQME